MKLFFIFFISICSNGSGSIPIVLNTWAFTQAAERVFSIMNRTSLSALDAVTIGCSFCEQEEHHCGYSVGYGGKPDENGETTLDAMIFDGATMNMGAVGGLRRIKNAIGVARHVLEFTEHSLVVGEMATEFAKQLRFPEESLATKYSTDRWHEWKSKRCQPNFWQNVEPDPAEFCGPYRTTILSNEIPLHQWQRGGSDDHDTIGMIAIDENGNVVAGTSTNGLIYKIPGRIGDSPIPGAGAYADNDVGAAVATGDGDIMLRFSPSFLAVEAMRRGASPTEAAILAIERIARKYPRFVGAVLAANNKGGFGAACNGMVTFSFCVASKDFGGVVVKNVECLSQDDDDHADLKEHEWSYDEQENWPNSCRGKMQSPIPIKSSQTIAVDYPKLNFDSQYYQPQRATVTNSGHTVMVQVVQTSHPPFFNGGGFDQQEYVLEAFHFHWPSEHTIDGRRYPLEAHFVHYARKHGSFANALNFVGGVVALATLYDVSQLPNPKFEALLKDVPLIRETLNEAYQLRDFVTVGDFLPNTNKFYRYEGSLTTPNCNEVVTWLVFKEPSQISYSQLTVLTDIWNTNDEYLRRNNRNLQDVYDREILVR